MAKLTRKRKREVVSHQDDPFLSWVEAGKLLGRSPQTVRRWALEGLMELHRVPGAPLRVRLSALRKFLGGSALSAEVPEDYVTEEERREEANADPGNNGGPKPGHADVDGDEGRGWSLEEGWKTAEEGEKSETEEKGS